MEDGHLKIKKFPVSQDMTLCLWLRANSSGFIVHYLAHNSENQETEFHIFVQKTGVEISLSGNPR